MPLKDLHNSILMDRPIQNLMVLFGCDQHRVVIMGVAELDDLPGFEEEGFYFAG